MATPVKKAKAGRTQRDTTLCREIEKVREREEKLEDQLLRLEVVMDIAKKKVKRLFEVSSCNYVKISPEGLQALLEKVSKS